MAHPDDTWEWAVDPDELVEYDLTWIERDVLFRGFLESGGPSRVTEELAVALGFSSTQDLHAEGARIQEALKAEQPMSHLDWARSLLTTEIVFMSDVLGAALDWAIVTGYSDQHTFEVIRAIQHRLVISRIVGRGLGTLPSRTRSGD